MVQCSKPKREPKTSLTCLLVWSAGPIPPDSPVCTNLFPGLSGHPGFLFSELPLQGCYTVMSGSGGSFPDFICLIFMMEAKADSVENKEIKGQEWEPTTFTTVVQSVFHSIFMIPTICGSSATSLTSCILALSARPDRSAGFSGIIHWGLEAWRFILHVLKHRICSNP